MKKKVGNSVEEENNFLKEKLKKINKQCPKG